MEAGEKRNALVKLRLCPDCSAKLNYRKKAREASAAARRTASEAAEDSESGGGSTKRVRTDDAAGDGAAAAGPPEAETVRSHWKGAAAVTAVDRTREEEYEDYFSDLFQ